MFSEPEVLKQLARLKSAQKILRTLSSAKKNTLLLELAQALLKNQDLILGANQKDLEALPKDASSAFRDRLQLDEIRISAMAEGLRQVAAHLDPVGVVEHTSELPNGLRVRKQRAPLGTIFMIFESRPNVVIEAFSLGFKAGNVMILRGGKESIHSCAALFGILNQSLNSQNLTSDLFWGIEQIDRKLVSFLLRQSRYIDVVVPRGGEGLIEFVVAESKIPIIKNDRGMCHIYVHQDADLEMARAIITNAKTQRPGVCNAAETVLIHQSLAPQLLPLLYAGMPQVEWFVCPESQKILNGKARVSLAQETHWDTEYLDFKLNCRIVPSLDEAILHISEHGSGHSEAIVTSDERAANTFEQEIDAAAVYWNASTRFTDGFELGLGGELGISTQKLHARGPVGLKELTSLRWIIEGNGQTRL